MTSESPLESKRGPSKLSIYDEPSPPLSLIALPPSQLQNQIGRIRSYTQSYLQDFGGKLQSLKDRWLGTEHRVENRLTQLRSPDEKFNPEIFYVGVAALAGSIVSRNRSFLLRWTLPPVFGFASASYLLPKTTQNLRSYTWNLEQEYTPSLARQHDRAYTFLESTFNKISDSTNLLRRQIDESIIAGAHQLENVSGLKIRQIVDQESGGTSVSDVE